MEEGRGEVHSLLSNRTRFSLFDRAAIWSPPSFSFWTKFSHRSKQRKRTKYPAETIATRLINCGKYLPIVVLFHRECVGKSGNLMAGSGISISKSARK